MKHPPYHLRPNKAVDRFLLLEIIQRLEDRCCLSKHTYFGFGGPFLDDFRLVCERYPLMRCVSIEENVDTYRRQRFHRNTKNLKLVHSDVRSYLRQELPSGVPCIFWLDYTNLEPARLTEFMELLGLVGPPSIVKVTVRAQVDDVTLGAANRLLTERNATDYRRDWLDGFQRRYDEFLSREVLPSDLRLPEHATLVQSMFEIAAQKTLPAAAGTVFQLVHSCRYADGPQMLSLTGIVCEGTDRSGLVELFRGWRHANVDWGAPAHIDVPVLSLKERLALERHLPLKTNTGKALQRSIGYTIDQSGASSLRKLQQYAEFHRLYPLYARMGV